MKFSFIVIPVTRIEDLPISRRLKNRLFADKVKTVGDLMAKAADPQWEVSLLNYYSYGNETARELHELIESVKQATPLGDKPLPTGAMLTAQSPIVCRPLVDWEKRRYEIANNVLAALCTKEHRGYSGGADGTTPLSEALAFAAVDYADALIRELQRDAAV